MTAIAPTTWLSANRHYLMCEIARVRLLIEAHVGVQSESEPIVQQELPLAPPSIEVICADFGLSDFERSLLLLCAGFELDERFGMLIGQAQGETGSRPPTLGLAIAALPNPDWNALLPVAPLRQWRMIEPGVGDSLTSRPLRLDERILHQLMGVGYLDERLSGLIKPVTDEGVLPGSYRLHASEIANAITGSQTQRMSSWPMIQLSGDAARSKVSLAAAACRSLGMKLHAVNGTDIPEQGADRETIVRLWDRESMLSRSAILVDLSSSTSVSPPVYDFLDRVQGIIFCAGSVTVSNTRRPILRLEVNRPAAAEQRVLWLSALGPSASALNGHLDAVTTQFSLDSEQIGTVARLVQCGSNDGELLSDRLWKECRNETRRPLDRLAQRIPAIAGMDNLVLPEPAHHTLTSIAAHVRKRSTVYEQWGFAAQGARGLGMTALFAGPSGTGKTMAAEALAKELGLDLYRIDLSQTVSKYIGETEKNLHAIFEGAEGCGAVLLFDEADALFGKRSEVKDSHDRYANIEVSYLLQRMEAYSGLAILTTNMRSALDTAFLRRIRFVVNFPFPDASQRRRIWQQIFPKELPTDQLDLDKLARLNVSGGSIRNIAMAAAFLAADAGEPVRMAHLRRGAESECQKMEKPISSAELGGWL